MDRSQTETTRLTQEQLDEIVHRLVEALAPERIIFFGSHAYGEPHADSDVDLMIIHDSASDRYDLSQRGYASLREFDVPVELHFCRAETFERFSAVVGSIQREVSLRGQVVYAA